MHARNQEKIDQPTDAQQPKREEPDGTRDRPTVVETVRASEAKQPEQVAQEFAVRVGYGRHDGVSVTSSQSAFNYSELQCL